MDLKPLFDFYKAILTMSSLSVDDEGYIYVTLAGTKKPCMLEGKRLLMPYKSRFKEFDATQHRFFHPMSESLVKGESEVLEKIRNTFLIKANYVIGRIGAALLQLLSTPSLHASLDINQAALLESIKDNFEDSAVKWSENVVLKMNRDKIPKFVDMRLKKQGIYKGKKVSRLGVVYFPLYESMSNPDSGVNLQVREVKLYKQLMEFMFDMSEQAYCRPSETDTAPYLYVFIKSAIAISEVINNLLDTFKNFICENDKDYDECYIKLDGLDLVESLSSMSLVLRHIPLQMGNDGRIEYTGEVPSAAAAQPVATPNVNTPMPPNASLPGVLPPAPPVMPATQARSPWDTISAMAPTQVPGMPQQQFNPMNITPSWMQPNVAPNFGVSNSVFNNGFNPIPNIPRF